MYSIDDIINRLQKYTTKPTEEVLHDYAQSLYVSTMDFTLKNKSLDYRKVWAFRTVLKKYEVRNESYITARDTP
jgi:hypothetical protein